MYNTRGHQPSFINHYMGKLRFTLTNVVFWIVLILSCLLAENLPFFNADPMKSFASDGAFILTIGIIGLLLVYYFFEHKKNGLKFDKILLPSLVVAGLLLILNIMRQTTRSFLSYSGMWDFIITFSPRDRLMASLQVVIWLAVIYALVFVYNRFRLNKESYRWLAKIYLFGTLLMCLIDIFIEGNVILGIMDGSYEGDGLAFFMGNSNVWSLLVFSGIISAILLCYKRYRWYYHVAMIGLTVFNILTACATTIYVTFLAVTCYTLYEIISHYKADKKQRRKWLFRYFGIAAGTILLFAILVLVKVSLFVNFWSFIYHQLFVKDFATLTGRTDMWQRVWGFMSRNPLDVIFGLGHQTGSLIYQEYMGHTVKSAHNAFLEIFLRYGIIGLLVYLGIIGLTIYCLVLHFKKKNYRFAVIYGICFLSIMFHSMTESTTLFTPNIGGLYFSFVFVLPVLNIIQEKRFKELKADLMTVNVSRGKVKSSTFVFAFILLMISTIVATLLKLAFNIGPYRFILVLLAIFVASIIVISIIRRNKEYQPFNIIANNSLLAYKELIAKEKDNEQ